MSKENIKAQTGVGMSFSLKKEVIDNCNSYNSINTNSFIIAEGCNNNSCKEPSKRIIGRGTYAGAEALERIKQGKSLHTYTYQCDNLQCDNMRGTI